MTIEEAEMILANEMPSCGEKFTFTEEEKTEAYSMAIKALEKQIPKKAKRYIDFNGIERNGCPACPRNEILYAGQEYCSVCGQKIDWEKEQKYRTLMMYIDKRNVKE